MRIEHLAEHVTAIPTLALWVQTEWGHLLPDATFETLAAQFEQRTTHHVIPETFVAVENDKVVGMASIVANDMSTRKELSPWLAAVYVDSGFRGRGIGSKLVLAVMQEAETLDVERIYLITPDRMSFYSRLGWKVLENTEYRGENVAIMWYDVKR